VLTQFTPRFQIPYPSVMACLPRNITHYTEHARSLVTIHALSRDLPDHTRRSNTRNTTVIPLQLLDFFQLHFSIFPLHLPIFPFDLVELVPSLSLVYINSATSRTHKVGKREAAFKTKITPDPSVTQSGNNSPSWAPRWRIKSSWYSTRSRPLSDIYFF
jgi:hypothetical protein